MTALQHTANPTFQIELRRDQCTVIARHGSDPATVKKQFAKLNRLLKTMPMGKADTVAELKKSRNQRGLV